MDPFRLSSNDGRRLASDCAGGAPRPTVRPPRLGGNARKGVFATRSTFRPNPIGMSLVELKEVVCHKDSVILKLGSLDLVDGTPVVDIKYQTVSPLC